MFGISLSSFFLNCGLTAEEYRTVYPLVWERNRRILEFTSVLAMGMGLLFLLINRLTGSAVWLPYLVLFLGSAVIFCLTRLLRGRNVRCGVSILLCYVQMALVCVYAGILSTQQSNYAVPATSIIVFIALLPLTIDDRPVRMYSVMLGETLLYLAVSHVMKSPEAFALDVINALTFCVVGMILYAVICTRNISELHQGLRMERIQKSVIDSLATVVEERDENTGGHIARTGDHVRALTEKMKTEARYAALSDEYCHNVILAAPMHDIGKIRIPDAILNKPGRLTPEEFEVMKRHTVYGEEIIRKTMQEVEKEDYFRIACSIARHHHERYDGTGYPDGLKGEEIPLEARIMAIADVYDALVSERVYKKPVRPDEARRIMREGLGTQFDPHLLPLFLASLEENSTGSR